MSALGDGKGNFDEVRGGRGDQESRGRSRLGYVGPLPLRDIVWGGSNGVFEEMVSVERRVGVSVGDAGEESNLKLPE